MSLCPSSFGATDSETNGRIAPRHVDFYDRTEHAMQLHERPIAGAMFVEQQGPEAADEESRFWAGNVRHIAETPAIGAPSRGSEVRVGPAPAARATGFDKDGRLAKAKPEASSTTAIVRL
jgi:plasmid stabilization system protein ParE